MRMRSIKFRILFSFSLLIIAIIAVTALEAVQTGGKLLGDSTKDTVIKLAQDDAKIVASRMETPINELTMLSTLDEISSMELSTQLAMLKKQLQHSNFLDIAIVQKNGSAFYTDGTEAQLGDRYYIRKALTGKANISDVIISEVTGKAVIMVAVPIKKGNEVVGALIGRKDGNTLSEIATDAGFGKEGFAFMINSSGQIIAHKNEELVNSEANPIELAKKDSSYQSLAEAEKIMLKKRTGMTNYKADGKVIYAGFTTISGTDWTIVVTATEKEATSAVQTLQLKMGIMVLISLLVTLVLAYFIGDAVTKSIKGVTRLSEKIASLDITENIPDKFLKLKDENGVLARSMQSIMESLRSIIGEITDSAASVASTAQELTATSEQSAHAAEEVSKTVEEIAKGATEQASNTENGSNKAIKLGELIDRNREQVHNMNITSGKVTEVVNVGLNDINHLNAISEENNAATKEIYGIIQKMNESTAKIGEASNVIAAIAEQTNLLSLNASIEAARAGEAGKGFAVVASEIKQLAGQSANSTNYINGIVSELQSVVTTAVQSIERVNEISKEQFDSAVNTRQKYEAIMGAMKDTDDAIKLLNESEVGMANAKNDIMDMLQTLSAIAEENAASTEEASSAMLEQSTSMEDIANSSEKLAQLANSLQEIIMRFRV